MQINQTPTKFPIPFGNNAASGTIRQVPTSSQINIQAGAASLTDGFPPITGLPVGSGGVPPFQQDFNGLLYQITLWSRWQAAGGTVTYDNTFATAIGGYPAGAVLSSSVTLGLFWVSTADNNTTNPDSGSAANWLAFGVPSLFASTPGSALQLNPRFFHVEQVRAVGVSPAPMTSTYQNWKLNTVFTNQVTGASLDPSTGIMTLPAGTYRVFAWGMACTAGQHRARLYNVTTSTEIKAGSTGDSYVDTGNGTTNPSMVQFRFTLAGVTQIALQHFNAPGSGPGTFGDNSTAYTNYDACVRLEQELGSQ